MRTQFGRPKSRLSETSSIRHHIRARYERDSKRRFGIMTFARPIIHSHEEGFVKQIESMQGVINVHRNVRVHRNFNGRQRREIDVVVVMENIILVAELKHFYGIVRFDEDSGHYVQEAKQSVTFDPQEIERIAADLRHMYVDCTGDVCPTIIGINLMTHPESSVIDELGSQNSVLFPYLGKELLQRVLHEYDTQADSPTTTEEMNSFLRSLPTWDIVQSDSDVVFGDVEDGLISNLREEYDIIKSVDVRRRWLRWLFKKPKHKLYGLKRYEYQWAEIDIEQQLKLIQPGRKQSTYDCMCWTLWFGSDRQYRKQFVGTMRSGLASLINRSNAASRFEVLTNALGNTTYGVVSYINYSFALVQIAPNVVGAAVGNEVDNLAVGDIIEVGIESVEDSKDIQLQVMGKRR